MTPHPSQSTDAIVWSLWIDGCGGFLLITSPKVVIGRVQSDPLAQTKADQGRIEVVADLPVRAAQLHRDATGYQLGVIQGDGSLLQQQRIDFSSGASTSLQIQSVVMQMSIPSPLSETAVVTVGRPHRLAEHTDAAILVADSLSIGPTPNHPIVHPAITDWFTLHWMPGDSKELCSAPNWCLRRPGDGETFDLIPGQRQIVDDLALTIQPAQKPNSLSI